ncbi:MAG: transglutaminase domain-containing protein [Verrucomicrobiales bacterium]|nr:transglutaminase domain-containing protein [Verrucomicrobiales bacterium]
MTLFFKSLRSPSHRLAWLFILTAGFSLAKEPAEIISPDFLENRTVKLTQTVNLRDVPEGAGKVQLWIPVPSDQNWQRVLDISVQEAPGDWKIVPQKESQGNFLYTEVINPPPGDLNVTVSCIVKREGVHFPIENLPKARNIQTDFFQTNLDTSVPLMGTSKSVEEMALEACGDETDVAKQAVSLVRKVAEYADHYSKDPTKPHCGIGSADDCMQNGGGCCTDLHSLFIAMARTRKIAARMQYGYRLLDSRENKEHDPGYRCWVEYFIPGAGWVPTDIVAADNASETNPYKWASLGPYRVWLWEGRSFELTPSNSSGAVDTMICGWAEIDGKPVDPLPGFDNSPPKMTRKVTFEILDHQRPEGAPKLPE